MGACDTWNVEINILVFESVMISLPAEFHFNKCENICDTNIWQMVVCTIIMVVCTIMW